jgi:uncharacterized damage-inducible protein DinB
MPSNLLTLRVMAYNNAWANHRLLSACRVLSQAEFEALSTRIEHAPHFHPNASAISRKRSERS